LGEAGLGKSRLIAELRAALADPASGLPVPEAGLAWHEGRSFSYETNIPYTPFLSLLGSLFPLRAELSDAEKYGRLKAQVAARLPERAGEVAPYLAALLGLDVPGEDGDLVRYLEPLPLREKAFGAVRELFAALTEAAPLVLVFEDLHWADPTSLDLVEFLLPL